MPDAQKISDDFLEVLFLIRHRILRHMHMPLPLNQFAIMMIIADEGSKTFSEIASRLSIVKQQLTPLINRLEEKKFIRRIPDTADKRRIKIEMTKKGYSFIYNNQEETRKRLQNTLYTLSDEEIKKFDDLLQTLLKLFGKI